VAVGQVPFKVLAFSPLSVISPFLHTHLHVKATLLTTTSGRSLGNGNLIKEKCIFGRKQPFSRFRCNWNQRKEAN